MSAANFRGDTGKRGKRGEIRSWTQLRILCSSGLDLDTIASDALCVVRRIVPCDSASLEIRRDPQGGVAIYNCPSSAGQTASSSAATVLGMAVSEELRLPNGLKAFLVVRRLREAPFSAREVGLLYSAARLLEGTAAVPEIETPLGPPQAEGLIVLDGRLRILSLSHRAEELLARVSQQNDPARLITELPTCLESLARNVLQEEYVAQRPAYIDLAVSGGQVRAAGYRLGAGADAPLKEVKMVGVLLQFRPSQRLQVWRAVDALGLSAQQSEVAYWLGQGLSRAGIREKMGISEAVLRDAVRSVLGYVGCANQDEWVNSLQRA